MIHDQENYLIYFYTTNSGKKILSEFIQSLEPKTRSRTWNTIHLLRQYGLSLIAEKYVKKINIKPAAYELRIIGKTQVRLLFIKYNQNSFLVLHGFIKKTQKIPLKHKEIAIKRAKEFI